MSGELVISICNLRYPILSQSYLFTVWVLQYTMIIIYSGKYFYTESNKLFASCKYWQILTVKSNTQACYWLAMKDCELIKSVNICWHGMYIFDQVPPARNGPDPHKFWCLTCADSSFLLVSPSSLFYLLEDIFIKLAHTSQGSPA